jgi:hypothetical protein
MCKPKNQINPGIWAVLRCADEAVLEKENAGGCAAVLCCAPVLDRQCCARRTRENTILMKLS